MSVKSPIKTYFLNFLFSIDEDAENTKTTNEQAIRSSAIDRQRVLEDIRR